jgi:hypothetical protein
MKTSIKIELANHILDRINDGIIDDTNGDEWHFYCFNEDYYLIGYYQCSEWLKNHELDSFEAVSIVQEYETENFGYITKKYDNSETVVNMLAYIFCEELLSEIDASDIEELREGCEIIINQEN